MLAYTYLFWAQVPATCQIRGDAARSQALAWLAYGLHTTPATKDIACDREADITLAVIDEVHQEYAGRHMYRSAIKMSTHDQVAMRCAYPAAPVVVSS